MILYFPTYPPGDSFWRWERQSSFNPDNKKSGEGVLWKLLLPTKHGQWCNFFFAQTIAYLKNWSALGIFLRLSIAGERFRGACAGEGKPCRCVNINVIANIADDIFDISDIAGTPKQ